MTTGKHLSWKNQVRLALCAALLGSLTGCVGYVEGPSVGVQVESPVFMEVDDYVYYPSYQCYYSVSRHQYAYRHGNAWVARPAPPHVSVQVLQASPSVPMEFHDSPAHHHDVVTKQYPKKWQPSAPQKDQNHKYDKRDNRGQNQEK